MMGWTFVFFFLVLLVFVLPLAPALLEWRGKSDNQPLKVVREHDGNIKYFALRFRQFAADHFAVLMHGVAPGGNLRGRLASGDAYQLVGAHGAMAESPVVLEGASCAQLLLGAASLRLADGLLFEREVYAVGTVTGGKHSAFRAILAGGAIELGEHCDILHWAHSDAAISLGSHARLYGRISADVEIALRQHSRFGRMQAPLIRFGPSAPAAAPAAPPSLTALALPGAIIDQAPERWLVAGSLDVPAASFHAASLVTRKDLTVGPGSHIGASIKSNGDLRLEGQVRIDGAVVCTGNMYIGPGCTIKGPVVCEQTVVIAAGTVIGSPDFPTTVTAPEIRIDEGVLAHGTVWARELGFVAPTATKASAP